MNNSAPIRSKIARTSTYALGLAVVLYTSYRVGQTWAASWFPDNQRVAYTHEDALVILDVATGSQRVFASPVPGTACLNLRWRPARNASVCG